MIVGSWCIAWFATRTLTRMRDSEVHYFLFLRGILIGIFCTVVGHTDRLRPYCVKEELFSQPLPIAGVGCRQVTRQAELMDGVQVFEFCVAVKLQAVQRE